MRFACSGRRGLDNLFSGYSRIVAANDWKYANFKDFTPAVTEASEWIMLSASKPTTRLFRYVQGFWKRK